MKNLLVKTMFAIALSIGIGTSSYAGVDHMDNVAFTQAIAKEKEDRAAAEKAPPGSMFLGIPDVIKQFADTSTNKMSGKMYEQGLSIAKSSIKWAQALAGSLALLYFVVESFAFMGGKHSSMKSAIVEITVPVLFCAYLLNSYESLINDFAGTQGLLQYIRDIASAGSQGENSIDVLFDSYKKVLTLTADSIKAAGKFYVGSWLSLNMSDTLTGLVDMLMTVIFALVIVFVALMGFAELVSLLLLGPFLGAIAIAFGPIFIAGLVTPWTREYFVKWMGFLVGSAVLSGVIGVCIKISSVLFTTLNYNEVASANTPTAMVMLTTLIIVVTVNSLISQAPAIASAMVPGSIGASKGGGGDAANHAKKAFSMVNPAGGVAGKLIRGSAKA